MTAETLDQYNARLQQLSKHCNFHDKDREVKSQIIQRCARSKVRDKGLSEPTITLQRLLTFGRTLEATLQQSKIMGNCSSSVPTPVHAVSKDGWRHHSACGGFGVAQQMAPHTYRNPPRTHFPPDRQGTPRKDNRPVVSSQQRYTFTRVQPRHVQGVVDRHTTIGECTKLGAGHATSIIN